jgi:isorenieratene synthase
MTGIARRGVRTAACFSLCVLAAQAQTASTKRVAIIGGGIGGGAASFFLQQQQVEVTVFEREDTLGGRSCSIPLPGTHSQT